MILAIDTSAAISVAVLEDEHVLAHTSEYAPRAHAELLASMIATALGDAGADGAHVTQVVAGTGPAPFTGLRVGLMTARTLSRVWGVPAHGVCSLDALGAAHGGEVTVVADARRKEVYWATYAAGMRVDGPHVSAPQAVAIRGDVVGRGAGLYQDAFPGAVSVDPDPAWLPRVHASLAAAGHVDFPLEPLYLRRPDVHGDAARP